MGPQSSVTFASLLMLLLMVAFPQLCHAQCGTCSHTCFPQDGVALKDAADAVVDGTWTSSHPDYATYGPINEWCTGNVRIMQGLFKNATSFNEDISQWNTRRVWNFDEMFYEARAFNIDISQWNTQRAINMRRMFANATSFNRDIKDWVTERVRNFRSTFEGASSFNPSALNWDTSAVTSMESMFRFATSFTVTSLSWNTGNVLNMKRMFQGTTSFNPSSLDFNTSSVNNMRFMFQDSPLFNAPDLASWDTASVTAMDSMFFDAHAFNADISSWTVTSVTNMASMFRRARAFDQPIGGWNTGNVASMNRMFRGARLFNADITSWDTSSVTDMSRMFKWTRNFDQRIIFWDTSAVEDFTEMFYSARGFNQNLCLWKYSGFQYDNATDIFTGSNCHYEDTPSLNDTYLGPFCADDCGPSAAPSSEPSSTPSCTPSASPTEPPSTEYGANLFYPNWVQGDDGCRNDGDEPTYMAADPNQWLSSSLEACCKKWFSMSTYSYDKCVGKYPPDSDDCVRFLYYPDWQGNNEGCIDDGQEPPYMLNNHQYFLFGSLEECCERFYAWDFYGCTKTSPELTNGDYYPDWSGSSSKTCLNSGDIPLYMYSNQKFYLSLTLEECCEKHFDWALTECLGEIAQGSNEWYVSWSDETCVQDCAGDSPCGGIKDRWEVSFSSREECCEKQLYWLTRRECFSNSV